MVVRRVVPCRWALVLILFNVGFSKEDEKKESDEKEKKKKEESASSPPEVGPAMPGNPKYWTKLLGLGFSEGTLEPQFDPDVMKYDLHIKSGKSTELLVTPMLNTNKYDLLFKPKLVWMGKTMDYSPIQNIEFKLQLDENGPGPLDKTVVLAVEDPKGGGGMFGGSGNKHEYKIHVTQTPDIEKIVTATKIEVVGHTVSGGLTHPENPYNESSPHNEIRYVVDEDVQYVDVTVTCQDKATGLKYNGRTYKAGETYTSQAFEGSTKSILGQCLYKSDQFTKGQEMQRTYVITVSRNAKLAGTTVDLRIWPPSQDGTCVRLDTSKGGPYEGWRPGWECMKAPPDAQFVGSYNNNKAELVVVNNKTGGRYRLWNGIPTSIPVTKDKHDDSLMLEAGEHQRLYTFLFGPPPSCMTFKYEKNDRFLDAAWKKDQVFPNISWKCAEKYEINNRTKDLYCKWRPCKEPRDTPICCTKVRASCATYDTLRYGAMDCPHGLVFHPENRCSWTPCTPAKRDVNLCCAPKVRGSAAPCNTMQCREDSVLVESASQLTCLGSPCTPADEAVCCRQRAICTTMQCPAGYSPKYNAALYLCAGEFCNILDRDTCCDAAAYCDQYKCPGPSKDNALARKNSLGWVQKPAAATIPCGGDPCIEWDTGICCNKLGMCSTLTCPVGYYQRDGAERIPCEGGGAHLCTIEDDLDTCCSPAASCDKSYVCSRGYRLKVGAKFIHCPGPSCTQDDRNLCCDMVNPFQAASTTVLYPQKGEGTCTMLDSPTSFNCKANSSMLHLTAEFKFDQPVGNKIIMGGVEITGRNALYHLPPISVYDTKNPLHVSIHSRVAGRGTPSDSIRIWVIPPARGTTTTKATVKVTTTTKKDKSSKKDEDESSKKKGSDNAEKETTLRKRRRLGDASPTASSRFSLAGLRQWFEAVLV